MLVQLELTIFQVAKATVDPVRKKRELDNPEKSSSAKSAKIIDPSLSPSER